LGKLERFLRLERARPDGKGPVDGSGSLDRFRDPPRPADGGHGEPDGAARVPRSCMNCGAENNPAAAKCFNCSEDLDSPGMRAHQRSARRRSLEQAEQRRREGEALAERELEKLRRESAARREPEQPPVPGTVHPPFDYAGASPLVWALRALGMIEDPWYRFAARLALIGGFLGLLVFSLSSPARFPFFLLAALLLGGAGLGRRRRWDRWDRWR
jgi:hypothetical protein